MRRCTFTKKDGEVTDDARLGRKVSQRLAVSAYALTGTTLRVYSCDNEVSDFLRDMRFPIL